ncbi:MAG: winged helix-turn-helix domain-containing protein [Pyrobaculum sp.]
MYSSVNAEREAVIEAALGSPTRIRIIIVLYKHGEMGLSDLAKRVGASSAVVNTQLKTLLEYGVVTVKRVGRMPLYKLSDVPEIRRLAEALAKADLLLTAEPTRG